MTTPASTARAHTHTHTHTHYMQTQVDLRLDGLPIKSVSADKQGPLSRQVYLSSFQEFVQWNIALSQTDCENWIPLHSKWRPPPPPPPPTPTQRKKIAGLRVSVLASLKRLHYFPFLFKTLNKITSLRKPRRALLSNDLSVSY